LSEIIPVNKTLIRTKSVLGFTIAFMVLTLNCPHLCCFWFICTSYNNWWLSESCLADLAERPPFEIVIENVWLERAPFSIYQDPIFWFVPPPPFEISESTPVLVLNWCQKEASQSTTLNYKSIPVWNKLEQMNKYYWNALNSYCLSTWATWQHSRIQWQLDGLDFMY